MSKYTIEIKRDQCTACGTCYSLDPDHFEGDDEGYAKVIGGETSAELSKGSFDDDGVAEAQDAAESCPEQIITVTED
ncbi:MAG: ferredoxin [Candidatus Ranarchaeia archaeon]